MYNSRERNFNVELNNLKLGRGRKTDDTNTKIISTIVVIALMLISAMGTAGIVLLFVLGALAFIAGVMYIVFKSQVVDPNCPNTTKGMAGDFMRTIIEKSEKEGDPMFKEARAHQKRNLTKADYARLDRCSHEESLKSLLEAGIIDRAEYAERMRKLNCTSVH